MSSTRYSSTGDFNPEAKLSTGPLRKINISTNIVAAVASNLPNEAERRAIMWLSNYAHLLGFTADALSTELDMEKSSIRAALTDPEHDRSRFMRQVQALRSRFEAGMDDPSSPNPFTPGTTFHDAYWPIAETVVSRKVRNAVKFGSQSAQLIEVIGKTRMGKTIAAAREFFRRLDESAWLHCPRPGPELHFGYACAKAVGVAAGSTTLKISQLLPKIESCFGPRKIRFLFIDEGHRLWPSDLRNEPKRIEWLRDLWELQGVTVIILATPQYSETFDEAMRDARYGWASGQWDGRIQRYHLADTMTDNDLATVARHHLPTGTPEIITTLVDQAKSSEGFCGAMVKAIQRAKFIASETGKPLCLDHIKTAQAELARGTRIAQLGTAKKLRRAA